MDAGPTARTKARIRLRSLGVHAIALVSEGANLCRWAEVRKGLNEMQNGTETAKGLVLPKAAQEQLGAGITQSIEALSAVLDLVKGAQVSEEAGVQVPPEFIEQIKQIGMMVAAIGDQFSATPAAPADAGLDEEVMAGLSADEVNLAKSASTSVVKAAIATMKRVETVSKGKVKMTFEQAMKLQGGCLEKLYSIVSELVPLVAEFGSDGVTAALAQTDKTQKSAPASTTTATTTETTGQTDPLARLTASMDKLQGEVDRIGKARNPSNAQPAHEQGNQAPTHRIRYGANYSEIVRKEREQGSTNQGGKTA